MNYINTETHDYPFSVENILAWHRNTSFPPGDEFVAPHPFAPVTPSKKPSFIFATQQVVEGAPELVDGVWVQRWSVIEIFATEAERMASIASANAADAANTRHAAKDARNAAVASITVTTGSGKTFDGDEISQGRMARAIIVLQATKTEETLWVLANNTPVQVTAAELIEALALAGAAQSAMWVIKA